MIMVMAMMVMVIIVMVMMMIKMVIMMMMMKLIIRMMMKMMIHGPHKVLSNLAVRLLFHDLSHFEDFSLSSSPKLCKYALQIYFSL